MTAKLYSLYEWNARNFLEEMVHLWNETLSDYFPLNKKLFERNVFHPLYLNLERSSLLIDNDTVVGYLIAKSDPFRVLGGRGSLWISCIVVHPAYQKKGYGSAMIKHALGDKGNVYDKYHIGSDPHHFFPGIPQELTEAQVFFKKHGFNLSGEAYDLHCDITKYHYTSPPLDEEYHVRRLLPKDQGPLFQHLKENYSLRWFEDTKWSLTYEKNISSLIGLFHREKVIGFAHVHTKGDNFWIPSVYWGKLHNPSFGGLGPVGIHKDYRGLGVGSYFMVESLKILQLEGVKEMEIDWTILVDYYKKFHFKPCRSYIHGQINNNVENES
ncbi:GNAT superfamily N-acetyltransferase [Evansella vedderi]|uniref:GNAT superfamily N-acetyltransferase n=1 Tax=Evansella vedderi TaxID=38282 RepID=A0ABT9ZQL6_9BACI|nr:GNAT family N-acetyltransferase [Evansella vedderi]MDQ0253017.1 GNAT superfamily N-acetyltransferase [Evansella vedderi]